MAMRQRPQSICPERTVTYLSGTDNYGLSNFAAELSSETNDAAHSL